MGNSKGSIWLARGAPKRWFAKNSNGFSVSNVPSRVGKISYNVTLGGDGSATFEVAVPAASSDVQWKLRWPYDFENVMCDACTVAEMAVNGIAVIQAAPGTTFKATAQIT